MDMRWEKAAQVREVVVKHLVSHVGERALADSPRFDEKRKIWLVPVLCRTSRGILLAGEIQLNQDLEIVYAPSKEELARIVEAQLERIPYLVYADREELEAKGFEPITLWKAPVNLPEEEQSAGTTLANVLQEKKSGYRTAKLTGETTETGIVSFTLVIEPGEVSGCVVECLELPGCCTQGRTVREALEHIVDAMEGHLSIVLEESAKQITVDEGIMEPRTIALPLRTSGSVLSILANDDVMIDPKLLRKLIKHAGITEDEFIKLLEEENESE